MESLKPMDLLVLLALAVMVAIGYIQGVPRRLFGIAAIVFALLVAVQLRGPLGGYLANEWNQIAPSYSYMVAFGALFLAGAIALSLGIQMTYQSAPLIKRYPVLDEALGGVLGFVEGVIILIAIFLILDPYFATVKVPGSGEFGPLRFLSQSLEGSLTASLMRETFVPAFLALFGGLFPADVVRTFAALLVARS
ncbi:MAG TPA: CvpA family protein [Candidatus Limnocylindrales bacterium]|nr:CvpA family protein [Candidatus Limnocylindrales bacterium]